MRERHLVELERMGGFTVAADEPDPRGWDVVACDGDVVGTVRTLVVDADRLKACYFVAELQPDARAVLLPVQLARLDERAQHVVYDVSPADRFGSLAEYRGEPPSAVEDDRIHEILAGAVRARPDPRYCVERRQHDRRCSTNQ